MKAFAHWNTARDAWEIPGTEGLFCEHLDVYSGTWPTSGLMLRGQAFPPPRSGPPTCGGGCSCSHGRKGTT